MIWGRIGGGGEFKEGFFFFFVKKGDIIIGLFVDGSDLLERK